MDYSRLFENIKKKKSFLCIGLDTDSQKIPAFLLEEEDPAFAFNRQIIDETWKYTIAYKPNMAFYESRGSSGWNTLEKTVRYIRQKYPDIFLIADAKRADIGNTSAMYAKAFFEHIDFDAVTVAPYMGSDSVTPFLSYPGRWVILLALTSNEGASDFQLTPEAGTGQRTFERVLHTSLKWGTKENVMYVVGATKAELLGDIRNIIPDHFILVPGIGAQGGSLEEVTRHGMNRHCGLLVNSSRGIIFAGHDAGFARIAGEKARELQEQMASCLSRENII